MNTRDAGVPPATNADELRILEDQLTRMRGMLFGYSERFFERIRTYLLITLALLVISGMGVFPGAVIAVPFLIPFAFLETGYLFYYTVFARRHAEYLERAINARLGADILVAHRLEAAYFYPPDKPKVAAISFGNPLGMMSVATFGYTLGAGILWLAGMEGIFELSGGTQGGPIEGPLSGIVAGGALLWTLAIAAYLSWTFLTRHDERRLLAELDAAYGAPDAPPSNP